MGSKNSSSVVTKASSPDILLIISLIQTGSANALPVIKSFPNFHKLLVSEVIHNKNHWNLLHLASWHGNSPLCIELLKLGFSPDFPDKHNETPLHLAALRGHYKTVEVLLSSDAKLLKNLVKAKQKNQTPLDLATNSGHCKIADLINSTLKDSIYISDLT